MEKQRLTIGGIPAVLWGPASGKLFIAAHGDGSNKEDAVISIFAEEAGRKGYRTLSFDLPGHGARKGEPRPCNPQNSVADLEKIMSYARRVSRDISLFGCSLGAYFSLLAYRGAPLRQSLFLSPVVDMKRIIENMMGWFGVSEARLEREKVVETPVKTLDWEDYQYVLAHPVEWDKPTKMLRGGRDTLCEGDVVADFARRTGAGLTVLEEGEHYFHTEGQLAFFRGWLAENISG